MTTLFQIGLANAATATALALVVYSVTRFWRHPPLVYALWMLVLLKLITPPLVSLPVAMDLAPRPAPTTPLPPGEALLNENSSTVGPSPDAIGVATPSASSTDLHRTDPPSTSPAARSAPAIAGALATTPSSQTSLFALGGSIVWLSGLVIWLAFVAVRVCRFQRLFTETQPAGETLQTEARAVAERLGLRRCPEVLLVDGRLPPMVWFVGRPKVLLPLRLIDGLDRHEQIALLAHEMAHCRRLDHWMRWLEVLICGLYWWLPVSWWARRRLQSAQEHLCDAWVLWAFPEQVKGYSQVLLKTVDFLSDAAEPLPAIASGFGQSHSLPRRLEMIVKKNELARRLSPLGYVLILLTAAAVLPLSLESSAADERNLKDEELTHRDNSPKEERKIPRGENTPTDMTLRLVWADAVDTFGAPSPDGDSLVFVDWERAGDLAVRELASGRVRHLTNKRSWRVSNEFSFFPIWKPDGRQIAYAWFDGKDTYELRIIAHHGGEPRVVYRDEDTYYVEPFGWSQDGRSILVGFKRADGFQLGLISVADGKPHVLKSLDWNWPVDASISPDGRFVVYDRPQDQDSAEHDIFILATDSGSESALVKHPGHDYAPLWTPDGKGIVFSSDRSGSVNLWIQRVENGLPSGALHQVPVDMNGSKPMGVTQHGAFFYASENELTKGDVYLAPFDRETGQLSGSPEKLAGRYEGINSRPAFSPDGKHLAMVSPRGPMSRQFSRSIVIRSLESGDERVLTPRINLMIPRDVRPQWAPDGRTLLMSGRDAAGRYGLYLIDVQTGKATPLKHMAAKGFRAIRAVWSVDGKSVFYNRIRWKKDPSVGSIARLNLATRKETVLYETIDEDGVYSMVPHSLALSPNGRQLAFANRSTIYVIPAAGGQPRIVVRAPEEGEIHWTVGIAWTPDGRWLIYGSARTPDKEDADFEPNTRKLWRVPIDGGSPQDLQLSVEGLRQIALHPDGHQIAFTADPSEAVQLFRGSWTLENFLSPLAENQ